MQETTNYGFRKPGGDDFINNEDWAAALDAVDTTLHTCEEDTKKAVEDLKTATGDVAETAKAAAQEVLYGKADKSTSRTITLTAEAWTGTTEPYAQTVQVEGITASNAVEITLGDATGEQALSCAEAQILRITQQEGTLTLYAYGSKPEIDIPIIVIFRGDLSNTGGDTPSIVTEVDPTVPAWAKQSTKPTYEFSEIRNAPEEISNLEIEESIQNIGGL